MIPWYITYHHFFQLLRGRTDQLDVWAGKRGSPVRTTPVTHEIGETDVKVVSVQAEV